MFDSSTLRAEYITSAESYRALSEKHGIPFSTLQRVAKRENWVELRRQKWDKANTVLINSLAEREARRAEKVYAAAEALLERITQGIADDSLTRSVNDIIKVATALKSLKNVFSIKSALDMEEQMARIAKLRKDCNVGREENEICVIVADDMSKYCA